MTTLYVKSQPGVPCPCEDSPRRYIPESFAVPVLSSSYYRRRIADGSLVQCKEPSPAPEVSAETKNDNKKSNSKKGFDK